jgi:hypothetical protein
MPATIPRATPLRANDTAHLHVLEAYIETLKAENEILKRRLVATEARAERLMVRAAERERCPWWCRRLGPPDDPATGTSATMNDPHPCSVDPRRLPFLP